jgi:drug/metabolite transporter (DMT)-like permease
MGFAAIALGAALWGSESTVRTPLLDHLSPSALVFAEIFLLALLSLPVAIRDRRFFRRLDCRGWLSLLGIAWGACGLGMLCLALAFGYGNPTTVVVLLNLQPILVVLLAKVFLKESVPPSYWPCLAAALIGSYFVTFGSHASVWTLSRDELVAAGLALATATLFAISTVLGRRMAMLTSSATLTASRYLLALPFIAIVAAARGEVENGLSGIAEHPIPLFYLAIVPGLAGMACFYWGLGRARASLASLAELATTAVALLLNRIFLGTEIDAVQMIGFVVLSTAVTSFGCLSVISAAPGLGHARTVMRSLTSIAQRGSASLTAH